MVAPRAPVAVCARVALDAPACGRSTSSLAVMGRRSLALWLSTLLLSAPLLAVADTSVVTLSPELQSVIYGHAPRFLVTVTAGDTPLRMMRLSARQDLRDNYAKIHVTALDKELRRKPVTVSIAISDPGPIRQSDLVVLAPGHAETFEHHGEPYDLAALEPGTYEATVDVTPDIGAPVIHSNAVTFLVITP